MKDREVFKTRFNMKAIVTEAPIALARTLEADSLGRIA